MARRLPSPAQPRRLHAVLIALSLLSLIWSGCAGKDAPAEDAVDDSGPVDAGLGTASLDVTVLDENELPIAGASVDLAELGQTTKTDDDGRALFTGLAAGTYTVRAIRLGFSSTQQRVELQDGGALEVTLRITPLPSVDPYFVTYAFRGYIACGGGFIVVAFTACGNFSTPAGNVTIDPNSRTFFDQYATYNLSTVIGEMVWQQTSAISSTELQLFLWQNHRCEPVCDPEYEEGQEQSASPIYLRSDGPFRGLEAGPNNLTHVVFTPFDSEDPPFVILSLQQSFNLFSTHFYFGEAPEGFTARPVG